MGPFLLTLLLLTTQASAGSPKPGFGKCWKSPEVALLSISIALAGQAPKLLDGSCPACEAAKAAKQVSKPELLSSLEAFRAKFAQGWKAPQGLDPAAGERMIGTISEIVFEGLNRLWPINPYLVRDALGRRQMGSARFAAIPAPKKPGKDPMPAAITDTFGGVISFSPGLMEQLAHPSGSGGASSEAAKAERNFLEEVVFHEFLHFLQFNNRNGDSEAHTPRGYEIRDAEMQTVYSCGAQAYAAGPIARRDGKVFKNSYLACMTCANAAAYADEGTTQRCDPEWIWDAHLRCQHLPVDPDGIEMTPAELEASSRR